MHDLYRDILIDILRRKAGRPGDNGAEFSNGVAMIKQRLTYCFTEPLELKKQYKLPPTSFDAIAFRE